jgi:hypothetical protein
VRKLPRVLILWGVPGVGKSTYADWLVKEKGFVRVDSDAGGAGNTRAAKAWRVVLATLGTPQQFAALREFMKVAPYNAQPVVVEYGMLANEGGIGLLRLMRDSGAETWWFDGDRDAAFEAWKAENVKASRDMADAKWREVVGIINDNMERITEFFGTNIARTIEFGPTHAPPEETFKAMFGDGS